MPDPSPLAVCLATIELALARRTRNEVDAAVDHYLTETRPQALTDSTPIFAVGLSYRTANTLDAAGIETLGELREALADDGGVTCRIRSIDGLGPAAVAECREVCGEG